MDKTYSLKDFTGHDLSGRKDMDNLVIEGSCFSNETPNAQIFPASLKNTIFVDCNLDNVFIPPGNTVKGGSTKFFQAQNDGNDWLLDPQTLQPLEPLDKVIYQKLGLSVDPADIPDVKQQKSVVQAKYEEIATAKAIAIKAIEDS